MNIKLELPETFYYGEERCGYYVTPEMKKVWAVLLDLIAEFTRVCEKYNLKYWMDGGTLLGSVRHKGFIPWDDDVDVIMMREDYEKFHKFAACEFKYPYALKSEYIHERGKLLNMTKLYNESTTLIDPYTRYMMDNGVKIDFTQGIFIDIFPFDNVPDDDDSAQKLFHDARKFAFKAQRFLNFTDNYIPSTILYRRPIKAAIHKFLSRFNPDIARKNFAKFVKTIQSCKDSNTKHVAKFCMIGDPKFLKRRIWRRSYFDETVYLPFENLNLPAPGGWENILNQFYGSWHKYYIRAKHGDFYDTERPYTYYTKEGHPIDDGAI